MITIDTSHPGEHLAEFIDEFGITRYRLAKSIHVQQTRGNEIIEGKRTISADTAVRLGRFFGNSAQFWLNLQAQYDIALAEQAVTDDITAVA
jgi:addiction module HigA family antidote